MKALVQSQTPIPAAILTEALPLLSLTGSRIRQTTGWVILDFPDGFDSFFIKVVEDRNDGIDAQTVAGKVIVEFTRIAPLRDAVLKGLCWFAAENDIAFIKSRSGAWQLQRGAGCNSTIHVGPRLTRIAQAESDHSAALLKLLENQWFPTLDLPKARELIARNSYPPVMPRWKEKDETVGIVGPGILAMDCNFDLEVGPKPRNADELADLILPHRHDPGQWVLNEFTQRVGRNRFSVDLTGKGSASFQFTDHLDEFEFHPRSKRLNRLILQTSKDATLENAVLLFQRLDRDRTRTLELLHHLMAQYGYSVSNGWPAHKLEFGRIHVEFRFNAGRDLTAKLHKSTPAQVVSVWLQKHKPFEPSPSMEELNSLSGVPTLSTCPIKSLFNEEFVARLTTEIPAEKLQRLDELSRSIVEQVRTSITNKGAGTRIFESEDPLDWWCKLFPYSRPGDVWADDDWWKEQATKSWHKCKPWNANVIMMAMGDMKPKADILERASVYPVWWDEILSDEEVWAVVDELPWIIDNDDYPKFPRALGNFPPQYARSRSMNCRDNLINAGEAKTESDRKDYLTRAIEAAAEIDEKSARVWLEPSEMEQLRKAAMAWARSSDPAELRNDLCLDLIHYFGWCEIAAVLEKNPFYIPAQDELLELGPDNKLPLQLLQAGCVRLAMHFCVGALRSEDPTFEKRVRKLAGTSNSKILNSARLMLRGMDGYARFVAAVTWLRCRVKKEQS